MENLSPEEFKKRIAEDPKAVIVDVRAPHEESEGLIDNSVNICITDPAFADNIEELSPDKNYYVYCRSGGRSESACKFMTKQGLTAYNLSGGILAWNQLK